MTQTARTDFLAGQGEAAPLASTRAIFAGQTAVITGASSGIGKAIAGELAAQGAALCLLGREQGALQTVARSLSPSAPVLTYEIDLAVLQQIENFAANFSSECGHADMLIHSAGVIAFGSMETASLSDFDWQLNVNLRAPYALTKALLPMLKALPGQVVFINSSAGLTPVPNSGQYSASKHALHAVAETLREEVRSHGVRILNVFVGRTATPMQAAVHAHEGRPYCPGKLMQPEHVAALVAHALSLPGTVEVSAIHMRSFAPWS